MAVDNIVMESSTGLSSLSDALIKHKSLFFIIFIFLGGFLAYTNYQRPERYRYGIEINAAHYTNFGHAPLKKTGAQSLRVYFMTPKDLYSQLTPLWLNHIISQYNKTFHTHFSPGSLVASQNKAHYLISLGYYGPGRIASQVQPLLFYTLSQIRKINAPAVTTQVTLWQKHISQLTNMKQMMSPLQLAKRNDLLKTLTARLQSLHPTQARSQFISIQNLSMSPILSWSLDLILALLGAILCVIVYVSLAKPSTWATIISDKTT